MKEREKGGREGKRKEEKKEGKMESRREEVGEKLDEIISDYSAFLSKVWKGHWKSLSCSPPLKEFHFCRDRPASVAHPTQSQARGSLWKEQAWCRAGLLGYYQWCSPRLEIWGCTAMTSTVPQGLLKGSTGGKDAPALRSFIHSQAAVIMWTDIAFLLEYGRQWEMMGISNGTSGLWSAAFHKSSLSS